MELNAFRERSVHLTKFLSPFSSNFAAAVSQWNATKSPSESNNFFLEKTSGLWRTFAVLFSSEIILPQEILHLSKFSIPRLTLSEVKGMAKIIEEWCNTAFSGMFLLFLLQTSLESFPHA